MPAGGGALLAGRGRVCWPLLARLHCGRGGCDVRALAGGLGGRRPLETRRRARWTAPCTSCRWRRWPTARRWRSTWPRWAPRWPKNPPMRAPSPSCRPLRTGTRPTSPSTCGLSRSGLLEVLMVAEPGCESDYRAMLHEHKSAYLSSWGRLLAHVAVEEPAPERKALKERFAAFNREWEESARVQRGYSVPDPELREALKRDNKEALLRLLRSVRRSALLQEPRQVRQVHAAADCHATRRIY